MEPDQYLGWLALALTPGLGARTAGKLLRAMGSPEAIFNASLTTLEAHRLPAAVAQAIHNREPLSAAAKELAQAPKGRAAVCSHRMSPSIHNLEVRIYDPPPLLLVCSRKH